MVTFIAAARFVVLNSAAPQQLLSTGRSFAHSTTQSGPDRPHVFPEAAQPRSGGGTRVGHCSRSGANGTPANPTTRAVKCPTSVKVGLSSGIGGQRGHRHHLAPGSPRPLNVSRQRTCRSEKEVTDPDVAGIDEAPRCSTRPYRLPQITLARISRNHMRRDTDEKPTPPTQPPFSRRNHSDERRDVRPPLAVVEPEQARRQDPRRLGAQTAQIGGVGALDPPRPLSPSRPLNPSGDEQDEQPREGERSAGDAGDEHAQPRIALLVAGLEDDRIRCHFREGACDSERAA